MKTFFVLFVCLTFYFSSNAQSSNIIPECPFGHHPVLVNTCDGFRFKRPIHDCERGFWFCSYGCTGWHIECWPNMPAAQKAGLNEKGGAMVWAELTEEGSVRFHFPAALKNLKAYTDNELTVFNVDEAMVLDFGIKKVKLVTGNYPVMEIDNELIVLVKCN